jgi:hypothetical protein
MMNDSSSLLIHLSRPFTAATASDRPTKGPKAVYSSNPVDD